MPLWPSSMTRSLIWAEGFGFTDRSQKLRITADTPFSLQSVSKTYTATAFLRAMDQGSFTLDQPLKNALPGFKVHSRWGESEVDEITFRHLLSHWAGLCHEAPVGNNYGDWHCTFDEHVRSISDTWLKCRVGERFRYSNLGYDLVGYALQLRAGKAIPAADARGIVRALGNDCRARLNRPKRSQTPNVPGATFERRRCLRSRCRCSPRGECIRPRDMAKFISFHLAGGIVTGPAPYQR